MIRSSGFPSHLYPNLRRNVNSALVEVLSYPPHERRQRLNVVEGDISSVSRHPLRHPSGSIPGITRFLTITLFIALFSTMMVPVSNVAATPLRAISPNLGAAASYSVLGGEAVTNTGPTTIPGDVGVSPGTSVTGFPPGMVGPPGIIHAGDANAAAAQSANAVAFGFLDQTCDVTYLGVKDLVGEMLVPGVYCADAFPLSGTLTLTGSGVWIFKSAADLITSGTANVVGGDPCNVWWREVSSATLGTNTSLIGNILASTSITLQDGVRLNGRALAQTGSVTLINNTFSGPLCAPTATTTPIATATTTPIATDIPLATETPAAATETPVAATETPVAATETPVATDIPVATPLVPRLPDTGVPRQYFPWSAVLVALGIGAMVLGLIIRMRRQTR